MRYTPTYIHVPAEFRNGISQAAPDMAAALLEVVQYMRSQSHDVPQILQDAVQWIEDFNWAGAAADLVTSRGAKLQAIQEDLMHCYTMDGRDLQMAEAIIVAVEQMTRAEQPRHGELTIWDYQLRNDLGVISCVLDPVKL